MKATEVLFRKRVIEQVKGITTEKNLDLKIQYGVLKHLGPGVFESGRAHFFEHTIGQETDHLSSLLRKVTSSYLSLRLKTYGKKYTEMVVHKNVPSMRHNLTKTILFCNR